MKLNVNVSWISMSKNIFNEELQEIKEDLMTWHRWLLLPLKHLRFVPPQLFEMPYTIGGQSKRMNDKIMPGPRHTNGGGGGYQGPVKIQFRKGAGLFQELKYLIS